MRTNLLPEKSKLLKSFRDKMKTGTLRPLMEEGQQMAKYVGKILNCFFWVINVISESRVKILMLCHMTLSICRENIHDNIINGWE